MSNINHPYPDPYPGIYMYGHEDVDYYLSSIKPDTKPGALPTKSPFQRFAEHPCAGDVKSGALGGLVSGSIVGGSLGGVPGAVAGGSLGGAIGGGVTSAVCLIREFAAKNKKP